MSSPLVHDKHPDGGDSANQPETDANFQETRQDAGPDSSGAALIPGLEGVQIQGRDREDRDGRMQEEPQGPSDNQQHQQNHAEQQQQQQQQQKQQQQPSYSYTSGNENTSSGPNQSSYFDTSRVPCVFFRQGRCVHGDGCKFSHSPDAVLPVCSFYSSRGFCKKGEQCLYFHEGYQYRMNHKFYHTSMDNNLRKEVVPPPVSRGGYSAPAGPGGPGQSQVQVQPQHQPLQHHQQQAQQQPPPPRQWGGYPGQVPQQQQGPGPAGPLGRSAPPPPPQQYGAQSPVYGRPVQGVPAPGPESYGAQGGYGGQAAAYGQPSGGYGQPARGYVASPAPVGYGAAPPPPRQAGGYPTNTVQAYYAPAQPSPPQPQHPQQMPTASQGYYVYPPQGQQQGMNYAQPVPGYGAQPQAMAPGPYGAPVPTPAPAAAGGPGQAAGYFVTPAVAYPGGPQPVAGTYFVPAVNSGPAAQAPAGPVGYAPQGYGAPQGGPGGGGGAAPQQQAYGSQGGYMAAPVAYGHGQQQQAGPQQGYYQQPGYGAAPGGGYEYGGDGGQGAGGGGNESHTGVKRRFDHKGMPATGTDPRKLARAEQR